MSTPITDKRSTHPPVIDKDGRVWTWRPRGEGYVIESMPDLDWRGRPWGIAEDTIRELYGKPKANAA